jgi:hypothetical protein
MRTTTETISSVIPAEITTPAPADNLSVAIADARAGLRTRYLAERAAERAETLALASQAYDAYQDSVRQKWITSWIASNTPVTQIAPASSLGPL